jgi:PAS domain S-box-containing protein
MSPPPADTQPPTGCQWFDELDEGVVILDPDGTVAWQNQSARKVLGEGAQAARGMPAGLALFGDGGEDVERIRRAIRDGEDFSDFTCRVETEEGGERWYAVSWRILKEGRDEGRRLIRFHDITGQKQAEQALHEREERFRLIAETSYDWEVWVGPHQEVLYISPSCELLTGRPAEEFLADSTLLERIVHPDDREMYAEHAERFADAAEGHIDFRILAPNGRKIWICHRCRPIYGSDGTFLGRRASNRDITDRKQAEESLAERQERLRSLFAALPIGISVIDADRRICEANSELEKILDLSVDELRQGVHTKRRYLRPDGTEMPMAEYPSVLALKENRAVKNVEIGVEKEDGTLIWTNVSAVPLHLSEWRIVMATADITNRKRAEEALARRTEELVRLNRDLAEAKDEADLYVDIMTHDAKNANMVSGTYADLLVELLAGDQWLYARKLRDAIQRSTEVLANVATIRRIQQESVNLVPVSLDPVIREQMENFPGRPIRYEGTDTVVRADGLLPVVLANLIGNAVKFGGSDVEIAIRVEERDSEVLVSVEDTGPGVPDEVKDRLFHRFERGRAARSGEGLGLFICRTVLGRYGSRIWVEDRVAGHPEEGAAFRFVLKKITGSSRRV